MTGVAAFAGLGGLYLVLAGSLSRNELITAAVLACAFTFLVLLLRLRQRRPIRLPVPPPRALARAFASLALDSGRVGVSLLRALVRRPAPDAGLVARQRFRPGGGRDDEAGRRALVILGCSLAPNGYVLDGRRRNEDALLLHRLVATQASGDPEWPI